MTLVAAAVGGALRGRAGARSRAITTVGAVVLYSLLVGLGASVVRSAIMAATAALGLALGRRAAAANGLCAAIAAMLVLDPATLGDAGFLLSAAATGGLLDSRKVRLLRKHTAEVRVGERDPSVCVF